MISLYIDLKASKNKSKGLTNEQLEFLKSVVTTGVGYAEQIYKTDKVSDRFKLAIEYISDTINKAGFDFNDLSKVITGLLESTVLQLPQTHKTE